MAELLAARTKDSEQLQQRAADGMLAARVLRAVAGAESKREGDGWRGSHGARGNWFITDQGDKSLVEALEEL